MIQLNLFSAAAAATRKLKTSCIREFAQISSNIIYDLQLSMAFMRVQTESASVLSVHEDLIRMQFPAVCNPMLE